MVAGAIVYPPRMKVTNLAMEIVLKVLERGLGETSSKKFPPDNITRTKLLPLEQTVPQVNGAGGGEAALSVPQSPLRIAVSDSAWPVWKTA